MSCSTSQDLNTFEHFEVHIRCAAKVYSITTYNFYLYDYMYYIYTLCVCMFICVYTYVHTDRYTHTM